MAEDMNDVIVPASRLQNLPDYKRYVKTLVDGKPVEPYFVNSFPPFDKLGRETSTEAVIARSATWYGRDRTEVEKKLNRFLSPV